MLLRPEEIHLRSSNSSGHSCVGEVGVSNYAGDVGIESFGQIMAYRGFPPVTEDLLFRFISKSVYSQ